MTTRKQRRRNGPRAATAATTERSGHRGPEAAPTLSVSFAVGLALFAQTAAAGPEGGEIVLGSGTITQDAGTTLITQGSDRLAIDWQSFDVGAGEIVRFDQPSASAAALNRIFDQNPSAIFGALEANGHVYLLNPNGIVFGESARVDVGALIASSLDLALDAFVSGHYTFDAAGGAAGPVINRGLITAATGGSVTLLGGTVANEGLILADLGQVTLGAGRRASLDFDGDGLLYFEIDAATLDNAAGADAAVANTGTIRADGGQVLLTARAAQNVFSSVVNNGGAIRAARIDSSGGVVRLLGEGGSVVTTGTIDAAGASERDTGGTVHVQGDRVGVLGAASIDVSGDLGGGTILVGGERRGAGATPTATHTQVAAGARLSASAGTSGDGGTIVVWADDATWFKGAADARGGSAGGDGGFVEISGKESLAFAGTVDTSAPNGRLGTLLFDPASITIIDADADEGDDDAELPDLSHQPPNLGGGFEISAGTLEGLAASSNVILEASGDIVMQDLADDVLGLGLSQADGGSLTITADVDGNGVGAFSMDASDTIRTEGADVTITGAGLTIGSIDVTGAGGDLSVGTIALSSSAGITIAGDLRADGANDGAAGGTITVAVDTNDDEAATLRLEGAVVAQTRTLAGSAAADDLLEANPNGADTFVLTGASSGTLNGTGFTDFGAVAGLGGDDRFDVDAAFAGTIAGGAGADTFNLADGASAAALDGGDGADTLAQIGGSATFTLTGTDAGTLNGVSFSAIENLVGTASADTFDLAFGLTGTAVGEGGDDVFNLGAGVTATIDGGAGSDRLFGANASSTFTVSAANAGTVEQGAGTVTFAGIEHLTGGTAADAFALEAALAGIANGGGGNDVFTLGAGLTAAIDGGAGEDTLVGANASSTFTVNAPNAGNVAQGGGTVTFSQVEHLTGGSAGDTFSIQAALSGALNGGAGNDVFTLAADVGGNVAGGADADTFNLAAGASAATLDGGGGADTLALLGGSATFTLTGANAGTLNGVPFSAVENLVGTASADTFNLAFGLTGTAAGEGGDDVFNLGAGVTATIDGGAGSDRLFGANASSTFTVSAANAGTVEQGAGTVTFAGVEHLTGGTAADTFALQATLAGVANGGGGNDVFNVSTGSAAAFIGGGGTDTLSYAAAAAPVTLGVAALVADGFEVVIGSANGGNVLQGTAAADTFATSGTDAGVVNGVLTYSSFETLQGQGGDDSFALQHDVSGSVEGGDGNDVFTLGAGLAAMIDGGAGEDTLVGANASSTFTVNAPNAGNVAQGGGTVTFSQVEHLTGGSAGDTFSIQAALSGAVNGGAGNDVFTLAANVAGGVAGGAGNDSFDVQASQSGSLDGGNDADTVTLAPGVSIAGALTGGAGGNDDDTLAQGGAAANSWLVNGLDAGLVNAQLFTEFENLVGGAGADSFALVGTLTGTAAGGDGNDTFNLLGGGAAALIGGAGDDAFNVIAGGAGTAFVGGTGTDTLNYAGSPGPVTLAVAALAANGIEVVAGSGSGSDVLEGTAGADSFVTTSVDAGIVNGTLAYSSFEFLQGQGGADSFLLQHGVSGGVDGGLGDDTIEVANGVLIGTIVGGAGADTLTLQGGSAIYTLTGPNAGTLNGSPFSAIENLVGTASADVFNLYFDLTGTASGQDGDDVFNLGAGAAATIAGGAGNDMLVADPGQATTFAVTAPDAGAVDNGGALVAFAGIENLTGSALGDTFVLDADLTGTAAGGAGDDAFRIAAGVAVAVDGGAGDDLLAGSDESSLFTVSGANSGTAVHGGGIATFVAVENLEGGAADDVFELGGSLSGTASGGAGNDLFVLDAGASAGVSGGAGADTLRASAATSFAVTAPNAGTAASGGGTVAFGAIENLEGSAQADTFTFASVLTGTAAGLGGNDVFAIEDGGSAGAIDGGAGNDTQTYAGSTGPVTVSVGALLSIESLIGSADGGDILVGTSGADAFATTGVDAGTVAGIAYSGFEHLRGQGGDDTFTLHHDVSGLVDGGDGDDTFALGPGVDAVVTGGSGADTLRGAAAQSTRFALSGADAGQALAGGGTVQFTSVETVVGGAHADTFDVDAPLSGGAFGGGGDDVFNVNAASIGALHGDDGADVFNLTAGIAATIVGGAGRDTLVADPATPTAFDVTAPDAGTVENGAAVVTFAEVENLTGSAGADSFVLGASLGGTAAGGAGDDVFLLGDSVSAAIDGGTGSDTVTGSDTATAFTVEAPNSGTAASGAGNVTVAAVERLQGGAGADTFTLLADFAGTIAGGAGDDRFDVRTGFGGELAGEDGADAFVLADGVVASGAIDGGAGRDTLDLTAHSAPRDVRLGPPGAIDGFDGSEASVATFRNIDAVIVDANGRSSVTGSDAPATWTLAGNAGNVYGDGAAAIELAGFASFRGGADADRFVLADGAHDGDLALDGGAGADRLEIDGGLEVAGDVTLAAIETVASTAGGMLTADTLSIDGATGGIGAADEPLVVRLATLRVTRSAGGLFLVDQTGGLHVPLAEAGDGDVAITAAEGDLLVGFIDAGAGGEPSTPPVAGAGGSVTLVAEQGSIEADVREAVNVRGDSATLRALLHIGAPREPVSIVIPSSQTITLTAINATINNFSLATVDDTLVAGIFSDFAANATAAAIGAGAASSLLDVAAIDWAGLDPNVALIDCLEPCIVLPPDQLEDDGFGALGDAAKLLLVRTSDDDWKVVPLFAADR